MKSSFVWFTALLLILATALVVESFEAPAGTAAHRRSAAACPAAADHGVAGHPFHLQAGPRTASWRLPLAGPSRSRPPSLRETCRLPLHPFHLH